MPQVGSAVGAAAAGHVHARVVLGHVGAGVHGARSAGTARLALHAEEGLMLVSQLVDFLTAGSTAGHAHWINGLVGWKGHGWSQRQG